MCYRVERNRDNDDDDDDDNYDWDIENDDSKRFSTMSAAHRTHKGTINCAISHSLGGIWRDAKTVDLFPRLLHTLIYPGLQPPIYPGEGGK